MVVVLVIGDGRCEIGGIVTSAAGIYRIVVTVVVHLDAETLEFLSGISLHRVGLLEARQWRGTIIEYRSVLGTAWTTHFLGSWSRFDYTRTRIINTQKNNTSANLLEFLRGGVVAEEEVAPFDDERFAAVEPAHRSSAHPADYPAAIPEMDPAPPADFRHPRNPCRERSTNPRNCCIQMDSEI